MGNASGKAQAQWVGAVGWLGCHGKQGTGMDGSRPQLQGRGLEDLWLRSVLEWHSITTGFSKLCLFLRIGTSHKMALTGLCRGTSL